MSEHGWILLNVVEFAWKWINCSDYARVLNRPRYSYNNVIIIVTNFITLEYLYARFTHLGALQPFYILLTRARNHHTGKCVPCNLTRFLCYQQLISKFKSNQTNKTFKIYHRVNCKSSFGICLLECHICNIQYAGKSKTPFNIRLNNHRKNVKNPNAIPACKRFNRNGHGFNNNGKIIIIEQLRNIHMKSTETLKERPKQRENFWIMKLETLASLGLNQELNWIHFMQTFLSPPLYFVSTDGIK